MKVRIEIEGDTNDTALARVLAAIGGSPAIVNNYTADAGNAHTTSTAPSSPASPSVPTATADDDDDGGPASDAAVDSTGLPWDERIHSGARSQNKDGTWKRKKGVGADAAAPIEAELRQALQGQPAPAAAPPLPVPPAMPAPVAAAPAMPPVPSMPAPAAPVPPMPTAAPSEQPALTFTDFMNKLGPIMASRPEVNVDYLTGIAQRFGMNVIADLHTKPELIGSVIATLQTEGKWA